MDIEYSDFEKVHIRSGTIVKAEPFPEARKPAYKVWVDFGSDLGLKQTSAQISDLYTPETLIGKKVMGVVNLGTKRIAGFKSEFLLVGFSNQEGSIVLAVADPTHALFVADGQNLH